MKRIPWLIPAVIVVLVVAFVVWRSRGTGGATPYRTADVERGSIEQRVTATGTIRPVVQVQVGSQVSGTVAKLFADYNSKVKKGDVLLQIDPSAFRARMLQNEAAVEHAQAALDDGNRQLKRAQELIKDNLVAETDLEAAQVAVKQRQADLKQAKAQLEASQVDLQNTTIRAPIDGVVISRSIDVGQTVAASLQAPQLFVLGNDLTQMQVETNIDEADIGQVRVGLPVSFTVDAFPDATFRGQVSQVRLEPITQQGVVTYTTVIGAPNPDGRLRPGMTANVSVLVNRRDDVLRIPAAALRFRPAGAGGGMGGGMANAGGGNVTFAGPAGGGPRGGAGGGAGMSGGGAGMARNAGANGGAGGGRGGFSNGAGDPQGGWAGGAGGRGGHHGWRRDSTASAGADGVPEGQMLKPGVVWVLRDGKPVKVRVMTGLSDGTNIEVHSDSLAAGDKVITGIELAPVKANNLQPPPGMGGPQFRGPRPAGGGRGR